MTALIALLAISFFGIVILVVSKMREKRTGGNVFLPQWIHRREQQWEHKTKFFAQKIGWWLGHHPPRAVRSVSKKVVDIVERI